jgi:hypothetical protein
MNINYYKIIGYTFDGMVIIRNIENNEIIFSNKMYLV